MVVISFILGFFVCFFGLLTIGFIMKNKKEKVSPLQSLKTGDIEKVVKDVLKEVEEDILKDWVLEKAEKKIREDKFNTIHNENKKKIEQCRSK